MQVKTFSAIIRKKMISWIETIDDSDLQKELVKNVLVSGGSIASMFLGEQVNDFDVYINNIDVLKRLTMYYAGKYNIEVLDGREKATLLQGIPMLVEVNNEIEQNNSHYAVSVRSLKEDQIKIFLDKGGKAVNKDATDEDKQKFIPVFFSPNAISLSNDVQIVIRFHGDHEQIHKTFDFIHATNYWTFADGLVTNKLALESLLTKQLKYQGSLYPLTTIIRIKKFLKRGWNISAGEMLKPMFQISELDLSDPDILEEQLIGVDVAYFSTLINILRGSKKESFGFNYLSEIIDDAMDYDFTMARINGMVK